MSEVFRITKQVAFRPPNGNMIRVPMMVSTRKNEKVFSIPNEAAADFFSPGEVKIYVLGKYIDGTLHIEQKLIDQCW